MKKIFIIFILALLCLCSTVFAIDTPKNVGIYICDEYHRPFSASDVSFEVNILGDQDHSLSDTSPGCGYVDTNGYPTGSDFGLCYVNLGSFDSDTEISVNNDLKWTVSITGYTDRIVYQNIDDLTGESQFNYNVEGDPFFLPVTLSSFTASFTDGTPTLMWTTQSEINNAGWNVYRAETEDMAASQQINPELVTGAGTTSESTDYLFTDEYDIENGKSYWYTLESVDYSGLTENYGPIRLDIPEDGGNTTPEVPIVYGLHNNYPNPFNPDTNIEFVLAEPAKVELNIYNVKGQKVITLCNGFENRVNEPLSYHWDGIDSRGRRVGSGMYFYQLQINGDNQAKKMVLIK